MPDITLEINEAVPVALGITNQAPIIINFGYGGTGSAAEFSVYYVAGEDINAGRCVIIDNGLAYHFQVSDPAHAGRAYGITIGSALTGQEVPIQLNGEVTDSAFSALDNLICWAAANGQLQTTLPIAGNLQKVGVGVGSNKLRIDFSTQIKLI